MLIMLMVVITVLAIPLVIVCEKSMTRFEPIRHSGDRDDIYMRSTNTITKTCDTRKTKARALNVTRVSRVIGVTWVIRVIISTQLVGVERVIILTNVIMVMRVILKRTRTMPKSSKTKESSKHNKNCKSNTKLQAIKRSETNKRNTRNDVSKSQNSNTTITMSKLNHSDKSNVVNESNRGNHSGQSNMRNTCIASNRSDASNLSNKRNNSCTSNKSDQSNKFMLRAPRRSGLFGVHICAGVPSTRRARTRHVAEAILWI